MTARAEFHAAHFIAGAWLPRSGAAYESVDPALGTALGTADPGTEEIADQAIAVARKAFFATDWSASPRMRADALYEFADRMEAKSARLTEVLLAEGGKLRAEAAGEVRGAISEARYYGGLARAIHGR
ncbi:MAG: aldehyde dehydrogenase family protein, partial [Pseudomonadota bacterium]